MKKEDSFKNSKVIILSIIIILVILITPQVIAMPPPSVTSTQLDKYDGSSNVIWQKSDMGFTLKEQHYLAIGSGRGDGAMRVYSTTDEIHEYTFLTDHWKKIDFGDAFLLNSGIAIGNVRNDGKDRVYVTKYSVHEYYYDSNSWIGGKVRDTSIIDEGLIMGDGHNDGVNRIYISDREGVAELSYNYGDWDLSRINSQPYAKLTITDGRNDGILRLYAAINNHVYEYSWSGKGWQAEDLAVFNIYNDMYSITAGNGRNDGKNRIYVSGDSKYPNNGAIYELSYDNHRWQYINVSDSVSVNHMIVANGRNDGKNRLYTGSSKGIGEYTYNGKWVKTSNVETNFNVNDLAIGNGRNDGINRIYVTGNDNHIYEYTTLNFGQVTSPFNGYVEGVATVSTLAKKEGFEQEQGEITDWWLISAILAILMLGGSSSYLWTKSSLKIVLQQTTVQADGESTLPVKVQFVNGFGQIIKYPQDKDVKIIAVSGMVENVVIPANKGFAEAVLTSSEECGPVTITAISDKKKVTAHVTFEVKGTGVCIHCGKEVHEGEKFCESCGKPLRA